MHSNVQARLGFVCKSKAFVHHIEIAFTLRVEALPRPCIPVNSRRDEELLVAFDVLIPEIVNHCLVSLDEGESCSNAPA